MNDDIDLDELEWHIAEGGVGRAAMVAAEALPKLIARVRKAERLHSEAEKQIECRNEMRARISELTRERDETRAEVERLRERYVQCAGASSKLANRCGKAEAEVERLRDIIRTGGASYRAERSVLGIPGGLDPEDAESLLESARLQGESVRQLGQIVELRAEVERWRHGVQIDGDYVCPDSLALTEARAEVERLQFRYEWAVRTARMVLSAFDVDEGDIGVQSSARAEVARIEEIARIEAELEKKP